MVTQIKLRVPPEVNGIQYNFCKNPKCPNFGIPVEEKAARGTNKYTVVGVGSGKQGYRCNCCGEHFTAKSNQAIFEEVIRLNQFRKPLTETCCPHETCENHTIPVSTPKKYRSMGYQQSGSKRYLCKSCGKIFSVGLPTKGQHDTTHNEMIFRMLVNYVPFNRILEIVGINWDMFYRRIDFIHKQCVDFANQQEQSLKNKFTKRLYLSVDRQNHLINWSNRKDRRNVTLSAISTADNTTGYVFGAHPNFDSSVDLVSAEDEALLLNEGAVDPAYRKYARIWLKHDLSKAIATSIKQVQQRAKERAVEKNQDPKTISERVLSNIEKKYRQLEDAEDTEAQNEDKLPDYGALVKNEYTMFAHFLAVKELFGNVGKYRFFLDQDSGIRGAFMNAFKDEIKAKTADAFYVSIEKEVTIDKRRQINDKAQKLLELYLELHPEYTEEEAKLELLKQAISKVQPYGKWQDKWVEHPIPSMSEPLKKMCWLTEDETMSLDHKAWLYNKASLHSVDNFFQKVRRRVKLLDRPIHSSGNAGRVWSGYSAYNPAMVGKLLDIFRVVHNYIDQKEIKIKTEELLKNGKPKNKIIRTTPAMQLGLAGKPMTYEEVLYFNS